MVAVLVGGSTCPGATLAFSVPFLYLQVFQQLQIWLKEKNSQPWMSPGLGTGCHHPLLVALEGVGWLPVRCSRATSLGWARGAPQFKLTPEGHTWVPGWWLCGCPPADPGDVAQHTGCLCWGQGPPLGRSAAGCLLALVLIPPPELTCLVHSLALGGSGVSLPWERGGVLVAMPRAGGREGGARRPPPPLLCLAAEGTSGMVDGNLGGDGWAPPTPFPLAGPWPPALCDRRPAAGAGFGPSRRKGGGCRQLCSFCHGCVPPPPRLAVSPSAIATPCPASQAGHLHPR